MDGKKFTSVPIKCRTCGTKSHMEILGSIKRDQTLIAGDDENVRYQEWEILICTHCDKVNIYYIFYAPEYQEVIEGGEIIYPPSITYKAPDEIDRVFRAAIDTIYHNPSAAVNQFRVIIEMIWANQISDKTRPRNLRGASGIIKDLMDRNILPGNYGDMADILAHIGNTGSHDDEIEVLREDAEKASRLCKLILEHVYGLNSEGIDLISKLEAKFPRREGWRSGKYVNSENW